MVGRKKDEAVFFFRSFFWTSKRKNRKEWKCKRCIQRVVLRRRGAGDEVLGKFTGACPGIRVQGSALGFIPFDWLKFVSKILILSIHEFIHVLVRFNFTTQERKDFSGDQTGQKGDYDCDQDTH